MQWDAQTIDFVIKINTNINADPQDETFPTTHIVLARQGPRH
jgi:hypothetical protein